MTHTIVEILIDKSGSMGYMKGAGAEHENQYLIDGVTRMSLIKKILIEQIIPTIKYADQVIIRTFRYERKTIGDKVIDEPSTPIIYNDSFKSEKISTIISLLTDPPPGGTPITAAIESAVLDLDRFQNSDRKIILLTDGEENGGGDYIEAAKKAEQLKGVECKIFIIGLAQDESSIKKSQSIATGGYFNINSKNFSSEEVKKVLEPMKVAVLENTIKNFQTISNNPITKIPEKPKEVAQHTEQISQNIDSTTLTIDSDYSEELRRKSEEFLYKYLCEKYSFDRVKWLNIDGESYISHDFEILKENGELLFIIECKGTSKEKPTFYLTSKEWSHFLENKEIYQICRVINVDSEMSVIVIENLLSEILNCQVVPYLLRPETLKEDRVFLTIIKNGR